MKILITGANGYIGQRLIPVLLEQGHELFCCVRNRQRFEAEYTHPRISIIEIDFLQPSENQSFPKEIDVAFYLIHSMSSMGDFAKKETTSAKNFIEILEKITCRQTIYLSGIVNEDVLSDHLSSRFNVEKILRSGKIPATVLRAGIIVGSGSASFEIIRDLVEKLPVMVAPKWLNTLCQPIAIRNVIQFLVRVMLREETFGKDFDIGGPEVLSYRQMLLQFAEMRKFRRYIITAPVMTPKLSSYWLYFITSTTFSLAANLVDSMKVNVVCRPNSLAEDLGIELFTYQQAVDRAFRRIEQNVVISSWRDAFSSFDTNPSLMEHVEVPKFGCFKNFKKREVTGKVAEVLEHIWRIGGKTGWYYGNSLWKIRGYLDKAMGGVGLHRGRTNPDKISAGDSLDFWRVLVVDKKNRRLLLFGEMKLPGDAWLEFKIVQKNGRWELHQTATFRPWGVWGRVYWYAMAPFHFVVFNGMANNLVKPENG